MLFTLVVLEAHLPNRPPSNIGVIVLDETANRLDIRCRTDFDLIADPENADILLGIAAMLESMAQEHGAAYVIDFLESTASNAIRVSDRMQLEAAHITEATAKAFEKYVVLGHTV